MNSNQLHSINPKNNIKIRSWDIPNQDKIDSIIKSTCDAQLIWEKTELDFRISLIKELANSLKDQKKELSAFMADEWANLFPKEN